MATTSTPVHTPPRPSSSGYAKLSSKKHQQYEDLDEQIRRLELEGNYLRSSISDSLARSQQITPVKAQANVLPSSLAISRSDLVNSSNEANKSTNLSKELEMHGNLDDQHRQRSMHRERMGSQFQYASTGSLLERLKLPVGLVSSTSNFGLSEPLKQPMGRYQSSLLGGHEDDFLDLRTKLEDSNTIIEKQREQFHLALEDIRTKYEGDIAAKDALLRAKERETANHGDIVTKLQQRIEQLQQDNRTHEETTSDTQEKLDVLLREQRLTEAAVGQVRGQVLDQERKRGRAFYEGVPVLQQDISVFVRSIEKCIQELDLDLELKRDQLKEANAKFELGKVMLQETEKKLEQDFQLRIAVVSKEHRDALALESEQLSSLKKQLSLTEDESARQKSQLEHRLQLKESTVADLESRLSLAKEDLATERRIWQTKIQSLEDALMTSQQELISFRTERNSRFQEKTEIESKHAELQNTFLKTKTNLELTSEELSCLKEREANLLSNLNCLQEEDKKKTFTIEDLERRLNGLKQDYDARLRQTMTNFEKDEEKNSEQKIQALLIQVNALTEKCHRVTLDLELTRTNHQNLQEKYLELRTSHETLCRQLEAATNAKEKLNAVLSERVAELAHVSRDRDSQTKSAESSSVELSSLRFQKDRLIIQLEEREKNYLAAREQNDRLSSLLDSSGAFRKERDEFEQRYVRTNAELEAVKIELASLRQNTSGFERLENSKRKLEDELEEKRDDLVKMTMEKDSLVAEMMESRRELVSLKEQVDILRRSLEQKDGGLEKEVSRISEKLRIAEHDLRTARKALRNHEEAGGRALEVASKMQKEVTAKRSEVDVLNSKIRQLQDSIDAAAREKKAVEEEMEMLATIVQSTAKQRDQLAEELRLYVVKHGQAQSEIVHLQAAVQKASVERASAQRQADQYVQDMTRLNLKHQLEIKELERKTVVPKPTESHHLRECELESSLQLETAQAKPEHQRYENEYPTSVKPLRQRQAKAVTSSNLNQVRLTEELRRSLEERDATTASALGEFDCDSTSGTVQSGVSNLDFVRQNIQTSRKWTDEKPTKEYRAINPESSVFELLSGRPSSDYPAENESRRHSKRRSNSKVFDKDTKVLYRRLEKRIETLTKMGGSLQKENQEIAKGMKDHAKRLTKIKTEFRK